MASDPLYIQLLKAQLAEAKRDTERLANWMIQNSYATGHGDSIAALVSELDWQHKERLNAAMAQKETKA